MKGLLLAGVFFILSWVLALVLLRREKKRRYLKCFFMAYGIMTIAYGVFYHLIPQNVWVLSEESIPSSTVVDFWNGFFVFSLIFHCFVDVSYATVITGFAADVIFHISIKGSLSENEIQNIYGITGEDDPPIDLRLNYLLRGKYLVPDSKGYRLSPKGEMVTAVAQFLQRLYRMGEGG